MRKLNRRVRAFLKCFSAVLVACAVTVMAASNGASATRFIREATHWLGRAPHALGRTNTLAICFGLCIVAALLISSHIHMRERMPGKKQWLLGGGVIAAAIAVLLALDATGTRKSKLAASGPGLTVIASGAQPASATGTGPGKPARPGKGIVAGTPPHISDTAAGSPTREEASFATTSPVLPEAGESDEGYEASEAPEESEAEESVEPTTPESSNVSATTRTSTSTFASSSSSSEGGAASAEASSESGVSSEAAASEESSEEECEEE